KHSARQRDVPRLHGDPGGGRVGRDDRQQRTRRQRGCFVGKGVEDRRGVGHGGLAECGPTIVLPARRSYWTVNSRVCTTMPPEEISSLYWPAGQPSGLLMLKSVVWAPAGTTLSWVSTTWPSS